MHLLKINDDGNFSLTTFVGSNVPSYAILSHTWKADDQELTFQDLISGTGRNKDGYRKIQFCGDQAKKDRLQYFWVDTCCIDKSSSSELSESINSMFQWYQNAEVCYVYLADLPPDSDLSRLQLCRWFTRGWTLQELVAPKVVKFYDYEWNAIGTKVELVDIISSSTSIPSHLLLGHSALSDSSIATRMSWAAQRQTTRLEDLAYCLLGIFEVNMPLIYGEGMRAFRRLQEEIIKRNNDLTIFAWELPQESRAQFVGLFAPSPSAFAASSGIIPFSDDSMNFSVTNRGLFFTGGTFIRVATVPTRGDRVETLYFIYSGLKLHMSVPTESGTFRRDVGIYLRKIGPKLFCREGLLPLAGLKTKIEQIEMYEVAEKYILLDPTPAITNSSLSFRNLAVHLPLHDAFQLREAIPETLWDHTDRVFLRPKRYHWIKHPIVLAMSFSVRLINATVPLVLLCDYREAVPILKVFNPNTYLQESKIIFQQKYREDGITWEDLEIQTPGIHALHDSTTMRIGTCLFVVSALLEKRTIQHLSHNVNVWSLFLTIIKVEAR
ncbi:hypothetical protein DPSP01_007010 [Paraphaeosphaeria sporulosa]